MVNQNADCKARQNNTPPDAAHQGITIWQVNINHYPNIDNLYERAWQEMCLFAW